MRAFLSFLRVLGSNFVDQQNHLLHLAKMSIGFELGEGTFVGLSAKGA